jgi:hypothetical protein
MSVQCRLHRRQAGPRGRHLRQSALLPHPHARRLAQRSRLRQTHALLPAAPGTAAAMPKRQRLPRPGLPDDDLSEWDVRLHPGGRRAGPERAVRRQSVRALLRGHLLPLRRHRVRSVGGLLHPELYGAGVWTGWLRGDGSVPAGRLPIRHDLQRQRSVPGHRHLHRVMLPERGLSGRGELRLQPRPKRLLPAKLRRQGLWL